MRRIESEQDIAEGVAHLIAVEPRFAAVIDASGPPPLRRRPDGFSALVEIIIGQQVSVASGRAIFARVRAAGCDAPEACAQAGEATLRGLGLSRPKVAAIQAAAEAVLTGRLSFERQREADLDAAMDEMMSIKGVGPWTAEIYQMFAVGRADILPAKDLALQEAARELFDLPERPAPAQLSALAAPWAPWRAVAARALWAYYRVVKGRSGQALEIEKGKTE
ncbi:MAG: DNA-3-methyladenine glycosylase 2 family protein [Neomegalonema sp.]|nr:DNA-3-methyladenine glycosylase 2 family protein [Neomegalonema sp.]